MKTNKLVWLGSALGALMCAAVVHAQDSLVLTEYSSTDLTAEWDGSVFLTVNNTGPDSWSFSTPDLLTGVAQWVDPADPGNVNQVGDFLGFFGGAVSDVPESGLLTLFEGPPNANDTADTTDFGDINGPVSVTFDDLNTAAGSGTATSLVPDTTTTMPLLGMALLGLSSFAKRFRK